MPILIRLYSLFYPIALFGARLLQPFHKKIKLGFHLRKKIDGKAPWLHYHRDCRPVWFHCASGEYEYAKPVIRLMKTKYPHLKIIVTYFSPSVLPALSKADNIDFYCPLPWDDAKTWQEFINHYQPKALLIARTDLWPMMLHLAKKNQLPSLLFSKTVNTNKSILQKQIHSTLLSQLNNIFCVSDKDRILLKQQMPHHSGLRTTGDTRYDQCFFRIQNSKQLKPLKNFHRPVFIAGSTWPQDEEALLPLFKENIATTSFIIAPHEPTPEHLKKLCQKINKFGLEYQLYSEINNWNPQAILLIDQVGILADLYSWADYSFIGGSMNRSVHSVMESLTLGLLTFVGPNHQNNREALEFKELQIKEVQPVQVIQGSNELIQKFQSLNGQWSQEHRFELQQALKNKLGSSEKVLRWIESVFEKTTHIKD